MAKTYEVEVTVSGVVAFPIDMLRYNAMYPATESDSGKIYRTILHENEGREVVKVRTITTNPAWTPTEGRWRSLGWEIQDVEYIR